LKQKPLCITIVNLGKTLDIPSFNFRPY
jgi:hypothetical protein